MDAMERATVTNQQVAEDLGITHSMVSRIRSGERIPSLNIMLKMHEEWDWPLEEQALSRHLGKFAEEFESRLAKRYAS